MVREKMIKADILIKEYIKMLKDFSIENKCKGKSADEYEKNVYGDYIVAYLGERPLMKDEVENEPDLKADHMKTIRGAFEKKLIFGKINELRVALQNKQNEINSCFSYVVSWNLTGKNVNVAIKGSHIDLDDMLNFDVDKIVELNKIDFNEDVKMEYVNKLYDLFAEMKANGIDINFLMEQGYLTQMPLRQSNRIRFFINDIDKNVSDEKKYLILKDMCGPNHY